MYDVAKKGIRPKPLAYVPPSLQGLMELCWQDAQDARPCMTRILESLRSIVTEMQVNLRACARLRAPARACSRLRACARDEGRHALSAHRPRPRLADACACGGAQGLGAQRCH